MSGLASGAAPAHENATKFPSGESEGFSSAPGSDVTVSKRISSDESLLRRRVTPHPTAPIKTSAAPPIHHRRRTRSSVDAGTCTSGPGIAATSASRTPWRFGGIDPVAGAISAAVAVPWNTGV
jgi:hypothetical protein